MNRKKEKQEMFRGGFFGLLKSRFDRSVSGIDLTVHGDKNIFVEGCTGIGEFTSDTVEFLGRGMKVLAFGENIELYTFENGCISASGKISNIKIIRGDKND